MVFILPGHYLDWKLPDNCLNWKILVIDPGKKASAQACFKGNVRILIVFFFSFFAIRIMFPIAIII